MAAELVRETWRALEEFNLNPPLALEALFVQLRGRFAARYSFELTILRMVTDPQ